ncbi:Hypothetical protein, conserved [Brucella intermedia LMG 3301]|nr:Hypothetical protein, conserved [Brucella intermedia LMG 3301]
MAGFYLHIPFLCCELGALIQTHNVQEDGMSGTIEIRKEDSSDGGRYAAVLDGSEAEMTYTKLGPSLISIDHTFVPDTMRGKGVAQALAKNAVLDARRSGWKIIPRCSFMHAQAMRHPDWSDVLGKE